MYMIIYIVYKDYLELEYIVNCNFIYLICYFEKRGFLLKKNKLNFY